MATHESIARTPPPPYDSVVFTSRRNDGDQALYKATADRILELAAEHDGYPVVESVRDATGVGITVSYWRDLDAVRRWHDAVEHKAAPGAWAIKMVRLLCGMHSLRRTRIRFRSLKVPDPVPGADVVELLEKRIKYVILLRCRLCLFMAGMEPQS